jgi:hypothetical protein
VRVQTVGAMDALLVARCSPHFFIYMYMYCFILPSHRKKEKEAEEKNPQEHLTRQT